VPQEEVALASKAWEEFTTRHSKPASAAGVNWRSYGYQIRDTTHVQIVNTQLTLLGHWAEYSDPKGSCLSARETLPHISLFAIGQVMTTVT